MGSTKSFIDRHVGTGDHPHIHGEHHSPAFSDREVKGSPPYTWGARMLLNQRLWSSGITPIYMGSTVADQYVASRYGDHPHIHGEHILSYVAKRKEVGSPPYTWGALVAS